MEPGFKQVFGQPNNVAKNRGFAYFEVNLLNTKKITLKKYLLKPGFLLILMLLKSRFHCIRNGGKFPCVGRLSRVGPFQFIFEIKRCRSSL